MAQLTDRTAIITGANQGLGKVIAETFLSRGASIVICARDEKLLADTAKQLEMHCAHPTQIAFQKADVASADDVGKLVEFALSQHGRVDILVNNAGIGGPKGLVEDVDWAEWVRTIEINLYGPLLMCRALLPHFKKNHYGKIINISGGGATAPMPRFSAYAAAKSALVRVTETIAHETLEFGIDVNAVAPGALKTRMLQEIIEAGPDKVGAEYFARIKKLSDEGGASMERAALLCAFLASEESNGITGRLLSAVWDPWEDLPKYLEKLRESEIYTLRRLVPADRGERWERA